MSGKNYAVLPAADLDGNAGNMGPGEKEQRFRPFMEKQRLLMLEKEK